MKTERLNFIRATIALVVLASICAGCFLVPTQHSRHSAIHDYARDGNLELVQADLSTNALDLNLPDDGGLTPLHLAALHCHTNVMAFLIKSGAKVNQKAQGGTTALHLAAQEGCIGGIELLLSNGAKINSRDAQRRTPLGRAEQWHRDGAAQTIRENGGAE